MSDLIMLTLNLTRPRLCSQDSLATYLEGGVTIPSFQAKNLDKISHLKQKWRLDVKEKAKKADVDTWREIAISDNAQ